MAKVAINNIGLAVVLAFYIVISVTQAHPPCGRLDNLAPSSGRPKDDRIHFRDQQGIRTTVINGTVIACYPDGTMVPMLPPSSNENSSEELTAYPTSSKWFNINSNIYQILILIASLFRIRSEQKILHISTSSYFTKRLY